MRTIPFKEEAWSLVPLLVLGLAGAVVTVLDFLFLQNKVLHAPAVVGGSLSMLLGALLEWKVRSTLVRQAGFDRASQTARLLIPDRHKLITQGVFSRIRHPLYLGRNLRSFGFALFFSSLWGALLMAFSGLGFLIRIHVEEKMLLEEFGDDYREYQKRTKKLIPYVY